MAIPSPLLRLLLSCDKSTKTLHHHHHHHDPTDSKKSTVSSLPTLPAEIQLLIYQHVLCPPEGVKIICEENRKFIFGRKRKQFKAFPKLPGGGLLRVCRAIHPLAWECLYGKNVFTLDMLCVDAVDFLNRLPPNASQLIKSLRLTPLLSQLDLIDGHGTFKEGRLLMTFIATEMKLRDIAIDMPTDPAAEAADKKDPRLGDSFVGEDLSEYWTWYFLYFICGAFALGHWDSIRLVHPKVYSDSIGVYAYENLRVHAQPTLLREKHRSILEELRPCGQINPTLESMGIRDLEINLRDIDRVNQIVGDAWKKNGFEVERGEQRAGEQGTVLIVRRVK